MKDKKNILITGTSKGIGAALAKYYVSCGYEVLGISRTKAALDCANYSHYALDLSNEQNVLEMFADIRKKYDKLDILVNNAAIQNINYVQLMSLNSLRSAYDVNVFGTFLVCREAAKLMKINSFGRIINISSVVVPLCSPGTAIYGSSKAALEQFSKVFAREVFPFGINVNTLGLSLVENSGMISNLSKKAIDEALQQTITKSLISVDDIVNAIDFLISEKAGKITAQTIYLGGI